MLLSFWLCSGRFTSLKCHYLTFWEWDSIKNSAHFLVCSGTTRTNPTDSTFKFKSLCIIQTTCASVCFAQKWPLEMSFKGKPFTLRLHNMYFITCTLLIQLVKSSWDTKTGYSSDNLVCAVDRTTRWPTWTQPSTWRRSTWTSPRCWTQKVSGRGGRLNNDDEENRLFPCSKTRMNSLRGAAPILSSDQKFLPGHGWTLQQQNFFVTFRKLRPCSSKSVKTGRVCTFFFYTHSFLHYDSCLQLRVEAWWQARDLRKETPGK